MYTIKYFSGKELTVDFKWSTIKGLIKKNENIYQVIRNNRDKDIWFERECPAV